MTLLHPHLGETRHQELRNSPFWHSSLFQSQLVKEGEDFLLIKGTSKDSQGFAPYQNKPFCGPHKRLLQEMPRQSSYQSFSSGRGKPKFRDSKGRFLLQNLPQSTSRRSPPFFQICQISSDSIRIQGPSKRPSSSRLYPVSSVKERNRKGGKCKISRVLQSPVPSTQASPKVEASHRPKQAQHFSTCRKV